MKIKTAEATGLQLDWGVGKVLQAEKLQLVEGGVIYKPSSGGRQVLRHTDPAVCMGLIDSWKINVKHIHYLTPNRAVLACWGSTLDDSGYMQAFGGTVAQAVARCVISMRLGDEFECPDELGVQS